MELKKELERTDQDVMILQNYGQNVGEVLKQVDNERFMVKASNGPRYLVGVREKLNKEQLKPGTRVALDYQTYTIVKMLPREADPLVFTMLLDSSEPKTDFAEIGGLGEQIRELREAIELPLSNPELFRRVGVRAPKGVLLYGPPGTGKTLLARYFSATPHRALASNVKASFLRVVAPAIIDKYIGESSRTIREMFAYAKEHKPCIIFMDEVDAIAGRRFTEGTSTDREIQRTLMELLNNLDGFEELDQVKMVMATNRADILDPALLRPGRIDRKIEIPLPNEAARAEILKIHAKMVTKQGEIEFEAVAKMAEDFNGADLRNVCTEAGMFAIREARPFVLHEDFMKAARKVKEKKKLETNLDYEQI